MKFTKESFVDGCMKTNELSACFTREQIEAMYDKIKRFPYDQNMSMQEKLFRRINEKSYSLAQHAI